MRRLHLNIEFHLNSRMLILGVKVWMTIISGLKNKRKKLLIIYDIIDETKRLAALSPIFFFGTTVEKFILVIN